MHINVYAVAGITAAVINLVGLTPYVIDIFRHKTKPERATWWIYAVLFLVLFAAQMNAGATWLLFVTGAYILSSVVIAILSLHYGYGSFHRRDTLSFLIAALGLVLWGITRQPLLAILMVIVVDFTGFWLTMIKTWHAPHSETLISWQLACGAAVISLLSIKTLSLDIVIYPLYAAIVEGLLIFEIIYRRRKVKQDLEDF